MIRLNKYIAMCGVCSRRKADELIESGKISINGETVTDLGRQVNEAEDIVCFYEKQLQLEEKKVYLMLNKPVGYVTTNADQFHRASTVDLIQESERVFPIGRLDQDTEGLLILTNDGEFANLLMHPRNKIEKTYLVKLDRRITKEQIDHLQNGVDIGDYVTKPARVNQKSERMIELVIAEGKNRQVRRMCEAVGITVLKLRRIKVGNLALGDLPVGKYRHLTEAEKNNI